MHYTFFRNKVKYRSNPTESLVPLNLEAVNAEYTVVIWKIGT